MTLGIRSYGAHIPRWRLQRQSIYQGMGWYMPALMMIAQGERSFANWDEDSLTMAVSAARDCLKGQDLAQVEALYCSSTTFPFVDRSASAVVGTALNLSPSLETADFTTSQRAGTSALLAAFHAIAAGQKQQALVAASDMRDARVASFYEMWYGDGAAALLLGRDEVIATLDETHSLSYDFVDHYRSEGQRFPYTWEERWVRDEGYAKIIPEAITGLLNKAGLGIDDIDHLVYPCFFKSEHQRIAKILGAKNTRLQDNLHDQCGETGVAHPLLMLIATLEVSKPGDKIVMASFGQGCDAFLFTVTEQIKELTSRRGCKGSLQDKRPTENYFRYLSFREQIEPERGIRSEGPTQTAMTALWRNREMIFGFVGGQCQKCKTPQFPPSQVCVNPECKHIGPQDPYYFADQQAHVKSFTGDMLAVSQDPPAIYGMIEFDQGGRLMMDFTDCALEDVAVGQPITLEFRRKYHDEGRGFIGYFWKAIPQKQTGKSKEAGPPIRFDGQVAIVTGAGGGLGRVYALELAKRGAKVVINDIGTARDGSGAISAGPAQQVVDEIKALGGEAVADTHSVATPEGGKALIETAMSNFGRVDILINNAGILRDKSFSKMTPEQWRDVMAVHLDGAFYTTQPAFEVMKAQGYGRIVMTTSAAGLYGNFGQANYAAAKLGLVGLMNTLKEEGARSSILVNTVAPIARSRMTEDVMPPDMLEKINPEAVAPIVLFLTSKDCQTTGHVYNAGMGYFNRALVLTARTHALANDGSPASPEDIEDALEQLNQLEELYPSENAMSFIGGFSAPPPPPTSKKAASNEDSGADNETARALEEVFAKMPASFRPEKAEGTHVVFQYALSGTGGGTWHVVVKDQTCNVQKGEHSAPTVTLKMSAQDFLRFVQGELDPMQAFTSGKLRISGDMMASRLIQKLFKLG
ncbi:MAG: SDR family NAD(P)-dependent oxidoreductase [Myxococcales bacterium]|nr:SDR family NAD(P)-dependent oxidoreductase [Myxococcales bacterium]